MVNKCPHCEKIILNKNQNKIIEVLKQKGELDFSQLSKLVGIANKNISNNILILESLRIVNIEKGGKYNRARVTLK